MKVRTAKGPECGVIRRGRPPCGGETRLDRETSTRLSEVEGALIVVRALELWEEEGEGSGW